MSYRTHCDWCGGHLAYEEDRAVMPVTIYHRTGKGSPEAKWIEETCVMRHFCVSPGAGGRDGRSRAELAAAGRPDTCYDRAIAAITGTKLSDPGMGMEWRMMPVDDGGQRPPTIEHETVPAMPASASDAIEIVSLGGEQITRELRDVIMERLAPKDRHVLPRAGIASLDQVAAMTDEQLLAIDGVGKRILKALRQAVSDRGGDDDGLMLARKVYELLQAGLPSLDERDPVHAVLAEALPSFAAALGERA